MSSFTATVKKTATTALRFTAETAGEATTGATRGIAIGLAVGTVAGTIKIIRTMSK